MHNGRREKRQSAKSCKAVVFVKASESQQQKNQQPYERNHFQYPFCRRKKGKGKRTLCQRRGERLNKRKHAGGKIGIDRGQRQAFLRKQKFEGKKVKRQRKAAGKQQGLFFFEKTKQTANQHQHRRGNASADRCGKKGNPPEPDHSQSPSNNFFNACRSSWVSATCPAMLVTKLLILPSYRSFTRVVASERA